MRLGPLVCGLLIIIIYLMDFLYFNRDFFILFPDSRIPRFPVLKIAPKTLAKTHFTNFNPITVRRDNRERRNPAKSIMVFYGDRLKYSQIVPTKI